MPKSVELLSASPKRVQGCSIRSLSICLKARGPTVDCLCHLARGGHRPGTLQAEGAEAGPIRDQEAATADDALLLLGADAEVETPVSAPAGTFAASISALECLVELPL